jgi:phosphatidylglycerol:prolipoprotein diacylglycerol transferase
MFTPFEKIFLTIGPLKFHYYGLMYALSFLFIYFVLPKIYKYRDLNIDQKTHENLCFWLTVSGLLGGRIFYVLFYNLEYFLNYPLKIFAVYEGGMASHGAFLGGVLGIFLFSKKNKINFLKVLDSIAILFAFCLALGRLGNFINSELYGRITDVSWCMNFNGQNECRHPSQIYAIIKNLIIFFTLFSLRKKSLKLGYFSVLFLSMYSVFRFIVEFFREPDPQIGYLFLGLTQGQILSLIMFSISLIFYFYLRKK